MEEFQKTFCCKKKKKVKQKVEALSFQSCEILKQINEKWTSKKKPHSDRNWVSCCLRDGLGKLLNTKVHERSF